jgi:hypothetical protein
MIGIYWLPESPEYLYMVYKYEECRNVIKRIAKINKVANFPQDFLFDTEEELINIK